MIITALTTTVAALNLTPALPALSHGSRSWSNYIADDKLHKFVHLDSPIADNIDLLQSGAIIRNYPVVLLFLWKSEIDWTPQQHDVKCIQPARLAVNKFLSLCQTITDSTGEKLFDEVKDAKEMEIINIFDANFSGIMLSVTLKPRYFTSICTG